MIPFPHPPEYDEDNFLGIKRSAETVPTIVKRSDVFDNMGSFLIYYMNLSIFTIIYSFYFAC